MNKVSFLLLCTLLSAFCASTSEAQDTIKIGAIFAKSGEAASPNMHHIQGVRFAVEKINKAGGILEKRIQLLEFDNHSTPIQSKQAAREAVEAGVVAVVGASWSSHSLAAASVLQKAEIPMISPDSTNPRVTEKGNFIFRACFIDPFQGEILARLAYREMQSKTAVIITNITSAYSTGLGGAFTETFETLGGKILADIGYKRMKRDFQDILTKTKELNPDVLFVPGHDESGFIVKQAQEMDVHAIMLGGDGWAYRLFFSNGGQELKQGYFTTHWYKEVGTEISRRFVEQYSKVYDISPLAAISYDTLNLLADAIKRAGNQNSLNIRDAIAATVGFKGVTGTITMNQNGDPQKSIVVMKIVNGKPLYYKTIDP
jgi:branched-chain amino acid transport system substrate-binding protein